MIDGHMSSPNWRSVVVSNSENSARHCRPRKTDREKSVKSSITRPRIVGFCSDLVHGFTEVAEWFKSIYDQIQEVDGAKIVP